MELKKVCKIIIVSHRWFLVEEYKKKVLLSVKDCKKEASGPRLVLRKPLGLELKRAKAQRHYIGWASGPNID